MRYIRKSGLEPNCPEREEIANENTRMSDMSDVSGAVWRKSKRSAGNGACVEIAQLPQSHVGVRDSKNVTGPVLVFESADFQAFLRCAKDSRFDI